MGANWTITVALWPAASVLEGLPPTIVKTPPEIAAAEMLTLASPVFVTLILCVALAPMLTFPNETVVGDGVNTPIPDVLPLLPLDASVA